MNAWNDMEELNALMESGLRMIGLAAVVAIIFALCIFGIPVAYEIARGLS